MLSTCISHHQANDYAALMEECEELRVQQLPAATFIHAKHPILGEVVGVSTVLGCYIMRGQP